MLRNALVLMVIIVAVAYGVAHEVAVRGPSFGLALDAVMSISAILLATELLLGKHVPNDAYNQHECEEVCGEEEDEDGLV